MREGDLAGRRLLLLAHDYPPVRSPQAIRASAFARGLAARGAEVHVLTRSARGVDAPAPGIVLHRCSPGPLEEAIERVAARRRRPAPAADAGRESGRGSPSLNWRGRLVRLLRRLADRLVFADARSLWAHAAIREARRLLAEARPDAVIAMHEPAASLQVARAVVPRGLPLLVDLADPVCAAYTPLHWRLPARALEAWALARADVLTVTDPRTSALLARRHPGRAPQGVVLTQGFSPHPPAACREPGGAQRPLRLVYTGRLYRFRPIGPMLAALARVDGVELHVAGPEMPAEVLAAAAVPGGRVRLHGDLDHDAALALQSGADVLLCIGNAGMPQTPGKVFEYFGWAIPVLYLSAADDDPVPALLRDTGRGMASALDPDAIASALAALRRAHLEGRPALGFDLDPRRVEAWSWDAITARLAGLLSGMVSR